jgi:hypothetical protein
MADGVRIVPYEKWLENNELLYYIRHNHDLSNEAVLRKAASLWGRPYDWRGIAYFTWRYLGLILFKKPLPMRNHGHSRGAYFCTEYAALILGRDCSMISPAKLCAQLLAKQGA